jgi:putative hemolysin
MVLLGELLPKRVALFFPERIAMYVAPVINHVGTIVAPAAHVLGRMTDQMIKLLPFPSRELSDSTVTEDEIKILVEQGAEAGLFDKAEETFLKRALGFADLTGADLMTPRTRVVSINIDDPVEQSVDLMLKEGFSNYPVYRKSQDNLIGVVSVKKVYGQLRRGQKPNLHDVMIPPIYLPDTAKASRMVEAMRTQRQHIIMLIDEFGGFAGVVSSNDLMEAVVGEVPGSNISAGPKFVRRADGSWLVDGMVGLYELEQEIGFVATDSVSEDCQTLSGLVMHYLDSIPREGQFVEMPHWRFEVVDMDHNRIDKVLVTRLEASADVVVNEGTYAVTHS